MLPRLVIVTDKVKVLALRIANQVETQTSMAIGFEFHNDLQCRIICHQAGIFTFPYDGHCLRITSQSGEQFLVVYLRIVRVTSDAFDQVRRRKIECQGVCPIVRHA